MCFSYLFRQDRLTRRNINRSPMIQGPAGRTIRGQLPPASAQNAETQSTSIGEEASSVPTAHLDDSVSLINGAAMPSQLTRADLDFALRRKTLAEQLRQARIYHLDNNDCFVPLSEIKRLITLEVIMSEILDGNPKINAADAQRCAAVVEKSATKLFATLALRQKGSTIRFFLDHKIFDCELPFPRSIDGGHWSLCRRESKQPIQEFENWENTEVELFAISQSWMMAPVFDKYDTKCKKFPDEVILPFMPAETKGKSGEGDDGGDDGDKADGIPHMKIGGYSEVNAYRIHPAHHNFWDTSIPLEEQPLVADKKLIAADEREFLKEKTILDALGPQNHPHLIQLLATYQKKKCYHLLFLCADGNLRNYWAKNKVPDFDRKTVLWSIRQMSGIASGLDCIHRFRVKYDLNVPGGTRTPASGGTLRVLAGEEKFGRHGDIKPENILYFKNGEGKLLKITDFGLGRFHGRDSRSGIDPRKVTGSLTYEPPECTIGRPVSRAYDIWSLACLYLEFVTWLLEGAEQITKFADERGTDIKSDPISDDNFFTTVADGSDAKVRGAVIQWVNRLHEHKNCSELIHNLLDLIMDRMLKPDPSERIGAPDLLKEMKNFVKRAEEDNSYLTRPVPRRRVTPHAAPQRSFTTPTGPSIRFAEGTIFSSSSRR